MTTGQLSTPEDFAKALIAVIPHARVRIADPPNKGLSLPNMQRTSSLKLAREVLGFSPQYDLKAAIADMCEWLSGLDPHDRA